MGRCIQVKLGMQFVYDSVCKLYELELYEDVTTLLELSTNELNTLTQIQSANIASIGADSYYQSDNYTKSQEKFSESELKYRLHRCLLKQGKREEAMGVLGSIPETDMSPKVQNPLLLLILLLDFILPLSFNFSPSNVWILFEVCGSINFIKKYRSMISSGPEIEFPKDFF
ncbi:unnamed protein product [Anisakis simplex]|uniref:Anaphase promoting complex subunit 7 (inferred by orthology to a D. melanogaster protein) n=1 Tax=Anisakis simplex TaxID=6269 RepID=A0A0M3KIE6_ANISI|nr:unnamed protein product [Anisakis simplex]